MYEELRCQNCGKHFATITGDNPEYTGTCACGTEHYIRTSIVVLRELNEARDTIAHLTAENEELRGSKDQLALALETVERLTAERDEARGLLLAMGDAALTSADESDLKDAEFFGTKDDACPLDAALWGILKYTIDHRAILSDSKEQNDE